LAYASACSRCLRAKRQHGGGALIAVMAVFAIILAVMALIITICDDRGPGDPLGETTAVLLIGQDIRGQWYTTPGQHGTQAVVPQGIDQAIEGHGRRRAEGGTSCQAEVAVCSAQCLPGNIRAHAAIAQDEG